MAKTSEQSTNQVKSRSLDERRSDRNIDGNGVNGGLSSRGDERRIKRQRYKCILDNVDNALRA